MSDLNDFVSMMLQSQNRFKIEPNHRFDWKRGEYSNTFGTAVVVGPEGEGYKTIAYFDSNGNFVRFA